MNQSFILIFLLTTISEHCSTHAPTWDKTISEYLYSMMSFEEFSTITKQGIICPKQNLKEINESVGKRNLIHLVSTHLPMLKTERVLGVGGDFENGDSFCGPYVIELPKNAFVHISMKNGSLFGPLVVYYNGTVEISSKGGEEDHGAWTLKYFTAIYRNSTGRYFSTLLREENRKCPSLVLDENLSARVATVEAMDLKNSFLVPTFKASSEQVDLQIPRHLIAEHKDDPRSMELILSSMYSLHCQTLNYTSPPLVTNQKKFDKTKNFPETAKTTRHTVFDDDEECSRHATVVWHDVGVLHRTYLACFPGSGSKWIMETVQFATGLGANDMNSYPPQLLLKTHHDAATQINEILSGKIELRRPSLDFRLQEILVPGGGRGILLIRNPYESILSWWNHVQTQSGYSVGLEPEEFVTSLKGAKFCRFAKAEIEMWKVVNLDWITLIHDLVVVHYERFREDWETELRRLLVFLKTPIDETRIRCLVRNPILVFKRETVALGREVFCQEVREMVEEAIVEVGEALEKRSLEKLPTHLYKYSRDYREPKKEL